MSPRLIQRTTHSVAVALVTAGFVVLPSAQAAEFIIESQTLGDAYQLVTSGNQLLNRWQMNQLLGLSIWESAEEGQPQHWSFSSLFRFDLDLGLTDAEIAEVPSFDRSRPSIQYAYADGRALLGGTTDVRIGRQLLADAMDYLMFDGVKVGVKLPWYLGVEAHGGYEVKQGFWPLAANQLELDGTRVIERVEDDDRPTAVVGAAIATRDLPFSNWRLGYRRRFSHGTSPRAGAAPSTAVDSEHVGLSFHQRIVKGLDTSGILSWNLFNGVFDRVQGTARWSPDAAHDLELQYVRLVPTFDADSIFNIFAAYPLNDGNLRWRFHPSDRDRVYLGGMMRLFGNENYADGFRSTPIDSVVEAWGAMGGWLHTFGPSGRDGRVSLDVALEDGYGGRRVLADAGGTWSIVPRAWEAEGRLTVVDFEDSSNPDRKSLSVGYQLGARYLAAGRHREDGQSARRSAFAVIFEHNMNTLQTHQLRLYAMIDLNFWL